MIPHELKAKTIKLPKTDDHSIVLITGSGLRHQRFAYRIQKEFGGLVLAWYQVEGETSLGSTMSLKKKLSILFQRAKKLMGLGDHGIEDIKRYIRIEGLIRTIKKPFHLSWELIDRIYWHQRTKSKYVSCEKRLFEQEIFELKKEAKLKPILVKDPNSKEFIEVIRKLHPYFFLSLGGSLYGKELLKNIRGIAINQHGGWAPIYKGSGTVWWALYHRNLDYVGNTVHITTSGIYAGPILGRAYPCLLSSDTLENCHLRVVAIGTELMIEIVKDIIHNRGKEITVYDQPDDVGKTYISSQLDWSVSRAIYRDFTNRWLQKELTRLRRF